MALKGMRVKPQDGMHYGSTRVEFDSVKNKCRIVSQSLLEYFEYMRLEADPEVLRYTPHPGPLIIHDEKGKESRSVFDAEVRMKSGEIIYEEVKYEKEIEKGTENPDDPFRSIRQISLQQEWCQREGYIYRLITDKELIKENPMLYNNCLYIVQRTRPERAGDTNRAKAVSVYNKLRETNKWTVISTLAHDINDTSELEELMTAVCYLIKEGYIAADIAQKPLYLGSEVKANG